VLVMGYRGDGQGRLNHRPIGQHYAVCGEGRLKHRPILWSRCALWWKSPAPADSGAIHKYNRLAQMMGLQVTFIKTTYIHSFNAIMISLPILVSLALLPFTLAQSSDTALPVAAIEAHFKQSQIVPSLLASFDPSALLTVNYAGVGDITPGQLLTKEQSAPTPVVAVTPVNSTVQLNGKYTITMVDADVVGSDLSKGVNRHWLINGVDITDGKVANASATAITTYAGPGPAAGSGPHRYVIILYRQPDSFKAPPDLSQPIGVTRFDLNAYAKNSGLGPVVAATYITVEDGTATASIPATSSVVSSTLTASQPTRTGTISGTTTIGANSPSKTNGALFLDSFSPLGVVLAGIVFMIAA